MLNQGKTEEARNAMVKTMVTITVGSPTFPSKVGDVF